VSDREFNLKCAISLSAFVPSHCPVVAFVRLIGLGRLGGTHDDMVRHDI